MDKIRRLMTRLSQVPYLVNHVNPVQIKSAFLCISLKVSGINEVM